MSPTTKKSHVCEISSCHGENLTEIQVALTCNISKSIRQHLYDQGVGTLSKDLLAA